MLRNSGHITRPFLEFKYFGFFLTHVTACKMHLNACLWIKPLYIFFPLKVYIYWKKNIILQIKLSYTLRIISHIISNFPFISGSECGLSVCFSCMLILTLILWMLRDRSIREINRTCNFDGMGTCSPNGYATFRGT